MVNGKYPCKSILDHCCPAPQRKLIKILLLIRQCHHEISIFDVVPLLESCGDIEGAGGCRRSAGQHKFGSWRAPKTFNLCICTFSMLGFSNRS